MTILNVILVLALVVCIFVTQFLNKDSNDESLKKLESAYLNWKDSIDNYLREISHYADRELSQNISKRFSFLSDRMKISRGEILRMFKYFNERYSFVDNNILSLDYLLDNDRKIRIFNQQVEELLVFHSDKLFYSRRDRDEEKTFSLKNLMSLEKEAERITEYDLKHLKENTDNLNKDLANLQMKFEKLCKENDHLIAAEILKNSSKGNSKEDYFSGYRKSLN